MIITKRPVVVNHLINNSGNFTNRSTLDNYWFTMSHDHIDTKQLKYWKFYYLPRDRVTSVTYNVVFGHFPRITSPFSILLHTIGRITSPFFILLRTFWHISSSFYVLLHPFDQVTSPLSYYLIAFIQVCPEPTTRTIGLLASATDASTMSGTSQCIVAKVEYIPENCAKYFLGFDICHGIILSFKRMYFFLLVASNYLHSHFSDALFLLGK